MKMWPAASGDLAPWVPGTSGRRGSAVQGWLIQCARTAQHKPRPIMRIEVPLISQNMRDAGPRAPPRKPHGPLGLGPSRLPSGTPAARRLLLSRVFPPSWVLLIPTQELREDKDRGLRRPNLPPRGGRFRPPEREDTGLWCFVTAASYTRCPNRYLGSRVPRHPPRHNPRVQRRADRCTDHGPSTQDNIIQPEKGTRPGRLWPVEQGRQKATSRLVPRVRNPHTQGAGAEGGAVGPPLRSGRVLELEAVAQFCGCHWVVHVNDGADQPSPVGPSPPPPAPLPQPAAGSGPSSPGSEP